MIYSTRGVVECLIKHEAELSAASLSYTRPHLEFCKSCTTRPQARINWLIVSRGLTFDLVTKRCALEAELPICLEARSSISTE